MKTDSQIAAPVVVIALTIMACAGPRPVLYPNAHYRNVGERVAASDIEGCRQLADAAGANRDPGKVTRTAGQTAEGGAIGAASGAVGGAIVGSAGIGAAVGAACGATAALLRSIFWGAPATSQAHIAYVNRCLSDLGYEPVGWQ